MEIILKQLIANVNSFEREASDPGFRLLPISQRMPVQMGLFEPTADIIQRIELKKIRGEIILFKIAKVELNYNWTKFRLAIFDELFSAPMTDDSVRHFVVYLGNPRAFAVTLKCYGCIEFAVITEVSKLFL